MQLWAWKTLPKTTMGGGDPRKIAICCPAHPIKCITAVALRRCSNTKGENENKLLFSVEPGSPSCLWPFARISHVPAQGMIPAVTSSRQLQWTVVPARRAFYMILPTPSISTTVHSSPQSMPLHTPGYCYCSYYGQTLMTAGMEGWLSQQKSPCNR